jgi:hypothetical protein
MGCRLVGERRALLRAALGVFGLAAVTGSARPRLAWAHHRHKRHRQRCRKRCKGNRRTCDRACDILDGDSQELCKQGCGIAMSQCRSGC